MSKENETVEEQMDTQRRRREKQNQYDKLTGLGWKSAGLLFLVIITALIVYAVFFR
ncbi:hypothetical protein [Salimicrobium flavidum]|uniref:Uncharacterized protein n=1 Tax=Salimicrobium flavidum TaxID=570947 RepID=A0A1N7JAH7_9BACI|nr:hypothetical protein [Salimicrobium flavidum]SIS46266.1 hypothetical protein SAMN05421687_104265 [Salimicrobium flavidum]